jgi:hypothetical protein
MARKRVAIVQSSYIPWKGYFDLIRAVDEFVLLDDVQFTRRDWRSRNRIKTKDGLSWLTVPVHSKGLYTQRILDTVIAEPDWGRRHWQTIRASYARTPGFDEFAPTIEPLFLQPASDRLSLVNHSFLVTISRLLGIETSITWSTDYHPRDGRNERLLDICLQVGASEYLSGPAASGYLDVAAFEAAGVHVRFADYSGYPEYPQPYPPFEHAVSVLDLLFCTGSRASEFLKLPWPEVSPA